MNGVLKSLPASKVLVLFDGYCNLCNGAVQFILKRDSRDTFRFAALSWPAGKEVIHAHPELTGADSIIVYAAGKGYTHSSAALVIAGRMPGLWPLLRVFWAVPPFIRDAVYKWIARNRYRWFGKKESCMIPETDLSHKFLSNRYSSV